MRKLLILAVAATLFAARPAHACGRNPGPCPPWLNAIGWTFVTGIVGGYAVGTGAFAYHDITTDDPSLSYGFAELTLNGSFATLMAVGAVKGAKDGNRSAIVYGGLTLVHTTLAIHGGSVIYERRSEIHTPPDALVWVGGLAYATNTLLWTSQLGERHGRGYGFAEAAVNAPLAIGFGYLAYDRARDWRGGPAFVYGGLGVISGALAIHGLRTALDPPEPPALDLLGTDIMPTVVSDGIELAPGIGASGAW